MNKKIKNIVFYKFWDPTREEPMQQACIFYEDGTVKNTTYEEGQELANEVVAEEKVATQAEFVKLINTKRIYALTGQEFERRFKEFLGTGAKTVPTTTTTALAVVPERKPMVIPTERKPVVVPPVSDAEKAAPATTKKAGLFDEDDNIPVIIPPVTTSKRKPVEAETETTVEGEKGKTETDGKPVVTTTPSDSETIAGKKVRKIKKEKEKKKTGLFKKLWVKVTAFVLAAAILITGAFHLGRNTKSGNIITNNINNVQTDSQNQQDAAFLALLNKTTNKDQKAAMQHMNTAIDSFNRDFASHYIEEGKNVKAALTWDEVMALNLAYNDYSKDQIKAMFNGSEVNSEAMSHAYKNATLQLMGAYVISTREHPVNIEAFLTNPDHHAFAAKYSDLFYKMKETTGDAQVAAINAFYQEIHKDFPISAEKREEGISHRDERAKVEAYKAVVVPMLSAAEIMFQNVSNVDRTLSDKAIAYFNDIGFCNIVDEKFERAETITLTAETDEKNPTYEKYQATKNLELIYEGNNVTIDSARDLSQLSEFQKWVNGHFEITDKGFTGTIIPNPTTSTSTKTESTTTITGDRNEAVNKAGEDAVKKAESAVDADLAAQNEAAKKAAEEAAKKESEKAQNEANQHNQNVQNQINDANNTINNGGTVNEDDFGGNVDFDDEHTDENGNLNDSVTDVTTDGEGAKTEDDLPDPNETGRDFDNNANSVGRGNTSAPTTSGTTSSEGIYEYEEPYYGGMSNEQIVDAYIASLEGVGVTESAKVYTK